AHIYHGGNEEAVTTVGLVENLPGVEIKVIDNRYIVVQLSAESKDLDFSVMLWQGAVGQREVFQQLLLQAKTDIPEFREGGTAHWTEEVITKGQLSPDTAAFVTDLLTLPIPNPWKRNVRAVDVAFFDGDRAALVTFEGDVWLVEGIDHKLN